MLLSGTSPQCEMAAILYAYFDRIKDCLPQYIASLRHPFYALPEGNKFSVVVTEYINNMIKKKLKLSHLFKKKNFITVILCANNSRL